MPAILIDVSRLLYRKFAKRLPTGVDRVSLEYVRRYRDAARAVLSLGAFNIVLPEVTSEQVFRLLLKQSVRTFSDWLFLLKLIVVACRSIWSEREVTGAILFNTGHMGLADGQYARGLRARGVRPVFMVHDLIPITHPEYCRPGELEKHRRRMHNVLLFGHGIITNSLATRASLESFSRRVALPMPPVVVAPLAPGLSYASPAVRPIKEPYFVVLSTIEPRKNHLMLLHLWRRMREQMGADTPR